MFLKNKVQPGFTLIELMVAIVVSSILIGITTSTYVLFRKSIEKDQLRAHITQNGRITLDRLSRELRQANALVTNLPDDPSDTSVPQPGEIEFEDGHTNDLSYRRYAITSGILRLQIKEYYFSYASSTRVRWNDSGNGGVSPNSRILSTQDIAENVQSIVFYGSNLLQLIITTSDGGNQSYVVRTTVLGRNL